MIIFIRQAPDVGLTHNWDRTTWNALVGGGPTSGVSHGQPNKRNFPVTPTPNPQYFLKSTAVQVGGVLPYKFRH